MLNPINVLETIMKLSPSILSIVVCVLFAVDGHGKCRKRRITYIQPVSPAPIFSPPNFGLQSFEDDDIVDRDVYKEVDIPAVPANLQNPQHPNLSCLLFADEGCNVSCGLMCDINGCQSDGFCSQKFYCQCNEVYFVQNRPVTANQFKKLAFDDLWNYKFKSSNNSPNPKNRIFQTDKLYSFVMPLLQDPHVSGKEIKETLIQKYPKLTSAQNLQPREHGIKARLFSGSEGEENLHKYIQNMMNTIQNSVYDRLNHTRYMRRIINLIKNIKNKEDLSYILRQIRLIGNDRLFERVRRYLMKRGFYFDSDLKPISKKAAFCVKKKPKCKCKKKIKPKRKRFFYSYGATTFDNEDDSDWVEDEEEVIEIALMNELIGSNNVEGTYPSTTIIAEEPMPEVNYVMTQEDEQIPDTEYETITRIKPQPQNSYAMTQQINTPDEYETITVVKPQPKNVYVMTQQTDIPDTKYQTINVVKPQPNIKYTIVQQPEEVPDTEYATITHIKPEPKIGYMMTQPVEQVPDTISHIKLQPEITIQPHKQIPTMEDVAVTTNIKPEPNIDYTMTQQAEKVPNTINHIKPEPEIVIQPHEEIPTVEDVAVTTIPPQSEVNTIDVMPDVFIDDSTPYSYTTSLDENQLDLPIESQYIITSNNPQNSSTIPVANEYEPTPPNEIQYMVTSDTSQYSSTASQQPKIFVEELNYPKYGTFFSGGSNNHVFENPTPEFSDTMFINNGNQDIPKSFMIPQTIYAEEFQQPSNTFFPNFNNPSEPVVTTQYMEEPSPQIVSPVQNPVPPSAPINLNQPSIMPSQTIVMSLESVSKSSTIPENKEEILQPAITTTQVLDGVYKQPSMSQNTVQNPQLTTIQQPQPTIVPTQNLLQQFATDKPVPKIPESSPYLNESPNITLKAYDISDSGPSIESLFIKHNQKPRKKGTTTTISSSSKIPINNPKSDAQYIIGTESMPTKQGLESSYVLPAPSPVLSTSPPQPYPYQTETPAYYDNNQLHSPPLQPTTTVSNLQSQSSKISSPEIHSPIITEPAQPSSYPITQKPKDKIYYQVLMDENGNIIKSANYKYPGQPQYTQEIQPQPVPVVQYTSTSDQPDNSLFDKFDRQMLLNAAKAKPGESKVIDYDIDTADNIPVFDIPSDIDLTSGTFGVTPDNLDNIAQLDEDGDGNWKTIPIDYTNNISTYNEMTNEPSTGIDLLPAYDSLNVPVIINEPEPREELANSVNSQYPFEIDRDNYQIKTNDGLTLDYDGNDTGNHNWSAYSINDANTPASISSANLDNIMSSTDTHIIDNNEDMEIPIFDASDDMDGPNHGYVSKSSTMKSNSLSTMKSNNMNSNENEITIDVLDEPGPIDGMTKGYNLASSSHTISTKTSSNTSVPIKTPNYNEHNTSTEAEDISTVCDDLVDPEDDLLNF